MDIEAARARFLAAQDHITQGLALLQEQLPETFIVKAGQSLTAALAQSLPIVTEPGARFEGRYVIPNNRTLLFAEGSGINGPTTGPAIYIGPGTKQVTIAGGDHVTQDDDAVIQVGENGPLQTTLEQQPEDITITGVRNSSHRGKRWLSIHGYRVKVRGCVVPDVWSRHDQDSQAIYVGNARGEIDIEDNAQLTAGSEPVLIGGAEVSTPGLVPRGIRIRRNNIKRPAAWRTDADSTKRRIKNGFELKDGEEGEFTENVIDGVWNDPRTTQGCFAILLTPALDGAKLTIPPKYTGRVRNWLIARNLVVNVGAGFQINGRSNQAVTLDRTDGIKIYENRVAISKTKNGGVGRFIQVSGEAGDTDIQGNTVLLEGGNSLIYAYRGSVADPVTGTSRTAGKFGRWNFSNNTAELGTYGINVDGDDNALEAVILNAFEGWTASGNAYRGAPRKGTPGNWFGDEAFGALEAVKALRALTA